MKQVLSLSLVFSFLSSSIIPLPASFASDLNISESSEMILSRGRRGGSRSSSGRSRNINRSGLGSRGSGRVSRSSSSSRIGNRSGTQDIRRPSSGSRIGDRTGTREIRRSNSGNNIGNRTGNRIGNNRIGDNNRTIRNRKDINIDSRSRNTNRINRNIINNGNIVVNPRGGYGGWGWNGGSPWYPNYNYWGGGFWGGFATGAITTAVTGAIINSSSSSNDTYVIIEKDSPGYSLFDSYGLTQVECYDTQDLVFIYGPQDSLMCANPTASVVAGYYDVDPEDMVLVYRE